MKDGGGGGRRGKRRNSSHLSQSIIALLHVTFRPLIPQLSSFLHRICVVPAPLGKKSGTGTFSVGSNGQLHRESWPGAASSEIELDVFLTTTGRRAFLHPPLAHPWAKACGAYHELQGKVWKLVYLKAGKWLELF